MYYFSILLYYLFFLLLYRDSVTEGGVDVGSQPYLVSMRTYG